MGMLSMHLEIKSVMIGSESMGFRMDFWRASLVTVGGKQVVY